MGDWVRRPEGAARESAPSGGSWEAQGGELPPALTGGDRGVGGEEGRRAGSAPYVACSRGARVRSRPQQSQVLVGRSFLP